MTTLERKAPVGSLGELAVDKQPRTHAPAFYRESARWTRSTPGAIPNKAFVRPWACCGWAGSMATIASRQSASAPTGYTSSVKAPADMGRQQIRLRATQRLVSKSLSS